MKGEVPSFERQGGKIIPTNVDRDPKWNCRGANKGSSEGKPFGELVIDYGHQSFILGAYRIA